MEDFFFNCFDNNYFKYVPFFAIFNLFINCGMLLRLPWIVGTHGWNVLSCCSCMPVSDGK